MADFVDHIFSFPDKGSAANDPTLAPYFVFPPPAGANPPIALLVFRDATKNSVNAEPGFWFSVCTQGVTAGFVGHPNLQIVNNRTAQLSGIPSVYFSTFDPARMAAIFSPFGTYTNNGLTVIPSGFGSEPVPPVL